VWGRAPERLTVRPTEYGTPSGPSRLLQAQRIRERLVDLVHPVPGNRSDILRNPLRDRDGSNLTTERHGVLGERAFGSLDQYLERVQPVANGRRERDHDRRRRIRVPDIVLDHETQAGSALFRAASRVQFDDNDVATVDVHLRLPLG